MKAARAWTDVRRHAAALTSPTATTLTTMKLSWSFIISSLYCAAEAANEGHVYIYDPMSRSSLQTPPTVDPNTARLIFAQRLGISRFHSIKTPTEVVLKQINAFGGHHPNIFGGDVKSTSKAHVLVWLEDVEDVEGTQGKRKSFVSVLTIIQRQLSIPSYGHRAF